MQCRGMGRTEWIPPEEKQQGISFNRVRIRQGPNHPHTLEQTSQSVERCVESCNEFTLVKNHSAENFLAERRLPLAGAHGVRNMMLRIAVPMEVVSACTENVFEQ